MLDPRSRTFARTAAERLDATAQPNDAFPLRQLHELITSDNTVGPPVDLEWEDVPTKSSTLTSTLRAAVLSPGATPTAVVVYFHGGDWVGGDTAMYESTARKLAERTNAVFVLPEQRPAQEAYAETLQRALEVTQWAGSPDGPTSPPLPVIVLGEGSGATLAAYAASQLPADEVAVEILMTPALDPSCASASYEDPEAQILAGAEAVRAGWSQVLADSPAPHFSPLTDGVADHPVSLVVSAEYDVRRDEAAQFAAALTAAGNPPVTRHHSEQVNNFFNIHSLPCGEIAFQQVITSVRASAALAAEGFLNPEELRTTLERTTKR